MRRRLLFSLAPFAVAAAVAVPARADISPPFSGLVGADASAPVDEAVDVAASIAASGQLVVVTTPSWSDQTGTLQRYERIAGRMEKVGTPITVVVGSGGLGWGIGLHNGSGGIDEPRKMEGDSRAPAGVFRLTRALGKLSAPKTRLPSRHLQVGDVCVDDVSHGAYNHIVEAGAPAPTAPWKSAEQLVRKDWLYDLIVVVDQNHAEATRGTIAGRGSCVFLHVWRREKSGTAGCTAMQKSDLQDVITWLDPTQQPLLVQLPRESLAKLRGGWGLP
jgi:D-alanyl-D-alanine dipeptidase